MIEPLSTSHTFLVLQLYGLLDHDGHGCWQGMRVAIVSTFPPKKCGLATFTVSLLGALRLKGTHPQGTSFGIIALSDPRDGIVYDDAALDYELQMDRHMPSPAMLQAVHFIHKAGYTHVIIQQVGKSSGLGRACRPGRHSAILERLAVVNIPGYICHGACVAKYTR